MNRSSTRASPGDQKGIANTEGVEFSVRVILPNGQSEVIADPKKALERLQQTDPVMVLGMKYYFPRFLNWMQNNVRGGVAAALPPLPQIYAESFLQATKDGMLPPRLPPPEFQVWYDAFMRRGADASQDCRILLTIRGQTAEYWLPSDVIPACHDVIARRTYENYTLPAVTPRAAIAGFTVGGPGGPGRFPR